MLSTPFSGYSVFAIILVWTASALGTRFVGDSLLVGFMVLAGQERLLPKKEEIFNCSDPCSAPVCSQWIDMALPKSGVGVFWSLDSAYPVGMFCSALFHLL